MSEVRRFPPGCAPIWGASPPPPRVRKYERLHVYDTKVTRVVILSAALVETFTHFADKRTTFCTGPQSGCWLDHAVVGKPRYHGFLAVQHEQLPITQLLDLTSVAVNVEPKLRAWAGDLRGRFVDVWRLRNFERAEMHCRLVEDVPRRGELHPCPDVAFLVERMIRAEDRDDDRNKPKVGHFARAGQSHAEQAQTRERGCANATPR